VWCPFCKDQKRVSHGRIAAHQLHQTVQAMNTEGRLVEAIVSVVCPGVGAFGRRGEFVRTEPDRRALVRCADCRKLIRLRAGDEQRAQEAPGDIYCFDCCAITPADAIEDEVYERWCSQVENDIRVQADLKAGVDPDYGPLNVDWP
jgi:hypothetical protein